MNHHNCFFFQQKTAYEMRSSDWSSDVCSSDLIDKCTLHGRGGSVGIIACRDREQWAAKCREAAQHFRPFSGRETVFDTCAPESPFVGDARRQVLEPSTLTAGEIAQDRKSTRLNSSH